jgi:D-galactarolactone isomerase
MQSTPRLVRLRSTAQYPDDAALLDIAMSWFPDDRGRRLALVENPEGLYGFPSIG